MANGITITADSGTEFSAGAAEYNSIDRLDDNTFVAAYRDNSDGNEGKVIVGTRSGTAITVNEADVQTFNNDTTINITVRSLSATLFVISYTDLNSQRYYVIAGTVSGTTITLGTAVQLINSNMTKWASVAKLDATNFVVSADGEGIFLQCFVGSISGTTISLGSSQSPSAYSNAVWLQSVGLDNTHFACFIATNGSTGCSAFVASVNTGAQTVVFGTNQANLLNSNFINAGTQQISKFSETSFIVGGQITDNSGLSMQALTCNLTSLSITAMGSYIQTTASANIQSNFGLTTISELNFIVSYYTTTGTEGEVRSGTLSAGTTLTLDDQGAQTFDNGASSYTGLCALTDTEFILAYKAG